MYCLVLGVLTSATLPTSYIYLQGGNGQLIPFFLISQDNETVLHAVDGRLDLEELKPHQSKIFRLQFENNNDVFTYDNNLYFYNQQEEEIYIHHNYITYNLLKKNSTLIFNLKKTENLVNPLEPSKTGKSKFDSTKSTDK